MLYAVSVCCKCCMLYAVCCMLYAVCWHVPVVASRFACRLSRPGLQDGFCRQETRRDRVHPRDRSVGRSLRALHPSFPSRLTWGFRLEVSPIPFRLFRQPLPIVPISSVSLAHTSRANSSAPPISVRGELHRYEAAYECTCTLVLRTRKRRRLTSRAACACSVT